MFDSLYSANTIFDAMLLFHLKVSCLYHGYVAPGETFSRNTGAVHFTIYVEVAKEDDTDYTQTGEMTRLNILAKRCKVLNKNI